MTSESAAPSLQPEPKGFRPDAGRRDRSVSLLATIAIHVGLILAAVMALPPDMVRKAHPESTLKTFAIETPSREAPPPPIAEPPPRSTPRALAPTRPFALPAARSEPRPRAALPAEQPAPPLVRPGPIAPPLPPRPPPPPATSTADDGSALLSRYQALIWERVNARRPAGMGFSGTAIVRFRVGRSGGLESAALLRGSGVMMLDKLALRAVRQAAPFPPPPAEIGDDRLIFDVPVQFH